MDRDDPLAMDPEAMRRLGYDVVDRLVDRARSLGDGPALRTASRDEMRALLHGPPPERPDAPAQVLDDLFHKVLPYLGSFDHPRFFAYVPGAGTWPAALADLVASAANIDAGEWREAAGPSQVELTVLDWFTAWIGYPSTAAGILVSGGSAANMQALAVARESLVGSMSDRVVLYAGDIAHSSVARGARALGFGPEQLRILPTDAAYRLRADTVGAAMDVDRAAGRVPLAVIAAGGATSTGSVDPLGELAELCGEREAWLHVDAAYGGFAILTERGREQLAGIELADSITLDPHKWLAMPFEVGCLMVRDGPLLRSAFEVVPEYLKDTQSIEAEVNFANRGLQLTRGARALKVWVAIRMFGVDAFRRAIDRAIDLAMFAQECVERSDRLELITPVGLGVLTLRRRFPGVADEEEVERYNAELVQRIAESGVGLVSSTRLRGRYVIRFCVLNHTSGRDDVERVIERLEREPVELPVRSSARSPERTSEAGVRQPWLGAELTVGSWTSIPLFASLDDDQRAMVARTGRLRSLASDEVVLREWEYGRQFFVILDGELDVRSRGRSLGTLGAGEFFGENAALDWGAGYSYGRTASVIALVPSTLLSIPGAVLDALRRSAPDVDRQLLAAIRERLGGSATVPTDPGRWPDAPGPGVG